MDKFILKTKSEIRQCAVHGKKNLEKNDLFGPNILENVAYSKFEKQPVIHIELL